MALDIQQIIANKTAGQTGTTSSQVKLSAGAAATTKSSSGIFA